MRHYAVQLREAEAQARGLTPELSRTQIYLRSERGTTRRTRSADPIVFGPRAIAAIRGPAALVFSLPFVT
jgi:hypothetical protein